MCLHRQVFIDFDKLHTLNAALKVQRLNFLPQGQTEDVGWYFRDDQLWLEYGAQVRKISSINPLSSLDFQGFHSLNVLSPPLPQSSGMLASSISSRDVEHQFTLNRQGSFTFMVGSTSYRLDFSGRGYFSHLSCVHFNKCVFIQLNITGGILLGSHDPNKLHHRPAQECTQASKIYLQQREVRLL